jgi:hypothetical protein
MRDPDEGRASITAACMMVAVGVLTLGFDLSQWRFSLAVGFSGVYAIAGREFILWAVKARQRQIKSNP